MANKNYSFIELLGSGAFGDVYKVKCEQDGEILAAKCLKILSSHLPQHQQKIFQRFEQECQILLRLKHQNIVQCCGVTADQYGIPVILMEIMDQTLTSYLNLHKEKEQGPLMFYVQVTLAHNIICALAFLHQNKIIHRDLSSNNVLVSEKEFQTVIAKVSDFGMAKLIHDVDPNKPLTTLPGTKEYMPPEAQTNPSTYNVQLDIFSYGVLIIQILTCLLPQPIEGPGIQQEKERRKNHIDLIDQTHPLLVNVALKCIDNADICRPAADNILTFLELLKQSQMYRESQNLVDLSTKSSHLQREVQRLKHELKRASDATSNLKYLHSWNWRQSQEASEEIRRSVDAVVCDNKVCIRRAHDKGEILMFDLNTEKWMEPFQHSYICSTLAAVNDQLVAIGGTENRADSSSCTNKVFCLYPTSYACELPSMHQERCRCTAAVCSEGQWLIVIGGEHPIGNFLETVELMHTRTYTWYFASSLPKTQYSCSAAILNNCVYILGGWTKRENPLCGAFKCDITSLLRSSKDSPYQNQDRSIWEAIAHPPTAQTTCVAYKGTLITIGGTWCKCYRCKCSKPTRNIYMYNAEEDIWESMGSTPEAHYLCHACVLPSSELIVIGGAVSDTEALTDVYISSP